MGFGVPVKKRPHTICAKYQFSSKNASTKLATSLKKDEAEKSNPTPVYQDAEVTLLLAISWLVKCVNRSCFWVMRKFFSFRNQTNKSCNVLLGNKKHQTSCCADCVWVLPSQNKPQFVKQHHNMKGKKS